MGAVASVSADTLAAARAGVVGLALVAIAASAFASADPQLEVRTATLPRFESVDSALRSSRLDVTLLPQRRSGFGFAFGVNSVSGANPALVPAASGMPSLDFGVHWRVMLDSNYRFDVTAYRRVPNADAISLIESHDPEYGARVEVGLGSIRSRSKGFIADRGFLGFQLEGGARLAIRRKFGGPMLYYRNTF
jgi:hypothetical protein